MRNSAVTGGGLRLWSPRARLRAASFLRRRYISADWLGGFMMASGRFFIVVADFNSTNLGAGPGADGDDSEEQLQQSNSLGLILVSAALLSEVLISSVQEKIMSKLKATQDELIFYTHLVGTCFLFFISLLTGELAQGTHSGSNTLHVARSSSPTLFI